METSTTAAAAPKYAYHITFVYAIKQPGVVTLIGETPEQAIELLKKMSASFDFLEVTEIVNYEDIPGLVKVREEQLRRQAEAEAENTTADTNSPKVH